MRRWRYAHGTDNTLREVEAATIDRLNKLRINLLRGAIEKEWKQLVGQHVTADRQKRYLAGMSAEVHGTTLSFVLTGFDAVAVDRGWAPPQTFGAQRLEGLDEYDGSEKDMRPWFLGGPNTKTDKNGKKYRFIKFELAKSADQLSKDFQKDFFKGLKKKYSEHFRNAAIENYSNQVRNLPITPVDAKKWVATRKRFKYTDEGGNTSLRTIPLPKLKQKHRTSIYAKILRTYHSDKSGRWTYTIFRTMKQGVSEDLWVTAGTPKSGVMDKLAKRLPEILQEMVDKNA